MIQLGRSKWLMAISSVILISISTHNLQAQVLKNIWPFSEKKDNKKPVANSRVLTSFDEAVLKTLRSDVTYLASDQLEGRRTGTKGEALAGMFIERRMASIGLFYYGQSYRRPFKFEWGKNLTPENRLRISNKFISIPEDAFPAPFSAAGSEDNVVLPNSTETASPWLVPLYENEQEANNPHFDWEKVTFERSKKAIEMGATAVLYYDSYGSKYFPSFSKFSELEALAIPVLIINNKVYQEHIKNMKVMQPLSFTIAFKKDFRDGTNMVGYINNNAEKTVIIGAHYDHLGYGEDGNSRSTEKEKQIHNGADDNASGVAAMLALADKIKRSNQKKYNYLFIAFSAEELGLLGSKAIVKEKDFDKRKIAYMLNLDMVGRLVDQKLTVGGVGTSPIWGSVVQPKPYSGIKISVDSAGIGPSDHATFYNDSIPVLFFFTGTHTDYHKPSDDANKINYRGILDIVNYVHQITVDMEGNGSPYFKQTKNTTTSRTKFKVTLGIMPDYSYQDGGVMVDGVLDEKPAAKAGVKKGDIVLQIGEIKINGMQSYMEALGSFNPGDATKVKVKRGATVQEFDLKF